MLTALAPSLRLSALTLKRGRSVVIDSFDFAHVAGRPVWVTGENGAGKSSLLQALAGRLRPAGGTVTLEPAGASVAFYHPGMRLPAHATLGEWWTAIGADLSSEPLSPVVPIRKPLAQLSTGEAKRLILLAILFRRTDFTFLDEPYEHLSPAAKAVLTTLLLERARSSVVVLATNQEIPERGDPAVVQLDSVPG